MKSFFFSIFILFIIFGCKSNDLPQNVTNNDFTVLIDASHGGKDPGAVNKTGITEKELSLSYSSSLESELKDNGINVVRTRYQDEFVSLFKRIKKAEVGKVDAIISIHFNYSRDESKNGFETYYQSENTQSLKLDSLIHSKIGKLNSLMDNGSQAGKFFILVNSPVPAVLVEIGHLSNKNDLSLINDREFQEKITKVIAEAIKEYFTGKKA